MDSSEIIRTIEWDMMDKAKFVPMSVLSTFSVRCCLYPLTVIKTRLQTSVLSGENYKGLFDTFRQMHRKEGIKAFYSGFWAGSFQIVSGVVYISTYEGVRHILNSYNASSQVKALVAGGCASLVGQTIIVPFDIISQHLMCLGVVKSKKVDQMAMNELGIKLTPGKSRLRITTEIIKRIYVLDGFRGFYRGYLASICTYVPNSAMWWTLYHFFQDHLYAVLSPDVPHLFIQCASGTLSGFTTTCVTNPIDMLRSNIQVGRLKSMHKAMQLLWESERWNVFKTGLSTRLVQSTFYSFFVILGYESIKKISVNEEYRKHIRW